MPNESTRLSRGIHIGAEQCLAMVVTDEFFLGAVVTLSSFVKAHPEFVDPIVILYSSQSAHLSRANRDFLGSLSGNIQCVDASDDEFWSRQAILRAEAATPPHLTAAFLILEAFRFRDVGRVVAIDADLLILDRISELWETGAPFGAVRAIDSDGGMPRDFFNSGVVTIGPPHLTGTTFSDLLFHTTTRHLPDYVGKADQRVLNSYFPAGRVVFLDPSLNTTKRNYPNSDRWSAAEQLARRPARVLHFVGQKPWQAKRNEREVRFTDVEQLWHAELRRAAPELAARHTPDTLVDLVRMPTEC